MVSNFFVVFRKFRFFAFTASFYNFCLDFVLKESNIRLLHAPKISSFIDRQQKNVFLNQTGLHKLSTFFTQKNQPDDNFGTFCELKMSDCFAA